MRLQEIFLAAGLGLLAATPGAPGSSNRPDECEGCVGIPGGPDSQSNSCGAIGIVAGVGSGVCELVSGDCDDSPCEAVFIYSFAFGPGGGNILWCKKSSTGGGWLCDYPGTDVGEDGYWSEEVFVGCGEWERRKIAACGLQVVTQAECTECN